MANIDYIVNSISANSIRIFYSEPVLNSSALSVSNYSVSLITPGVYLPSLISVEPLVPDNRQYLLRFNNDFHSGSTYSVEIANVVAENGNTVMLTAHNFISYPPGGAKVLGAYLSVHGAIDLVFDRPVGPYTTLALTTLTDGDLVSNPMSPFTWNSSIAENTIRSYLLPGVPVSDEWYMDFGRIQDISGNLASGTVHVSIPKEIPRPLDFSVNNTLLLTRAIATNWEPYYNFLNVRCYFNYALDSSVYNPLNIVPVQINVHLGDDSANTVISPDAVDLLTLITLLNDFKSCFNTHLTKSNLHLLEDTLNIVTSPDATDLPSAGSLLVEEIQNYGSHIYSETFHNAKDSVHLVPQIPGDLNDLSSLCNAANMLKASYNGHVQLEYGGSFVNFSYAGTLTAELSQDTPRAVNSEYFYCLDVRVASLSPKAQFYLSCSLSSSDGSISTLSTIKNYIRRLELSPNVITGYLINPNEFVIQTDSSIESKSAYTSILNPNFNINVPVLPYSTYEHAYNCLIETMIQYDSHRLYQPHILIDTINTIDAGDLPPTSLFVNAVNILLSKFNAHKSSTSFHPLPDYFGRILNPAIDYDSALVLLRGIRDQLNAHTNNSVLHLNIGQQWITMDPINAVVVDLPYLKNLDTYNVPLSLSKSLLNPGYLDVYEGTNIEYSFIGVGYNPSLSSAVPTPAISPFKVSSNYFSDTLTVFFDSVMDKGTLPLLTVSGGSIVVTDKRWISDFSAEVNVKQMTSSPYSINAAGMKDIAGNQVL